MCHKVNRAAVVGRTETILLIPVNNNTDAQGAGRRARARATARR
eukprot:COSAG02_NODE_8658_length_2488_cov_7.065718_1_plen_43_part_10